MGLSTWSRTNTIPAKVSGPARWSPRCTAPTSTPIAMANTAGSRPRRTSATHQATARTRSAFGRTPKNVHSLRSRRRRNTDRLLSDRSSARGASLEGRTRHCLSPHDGDPAAVVRHVEEAPRQLLASEGQRLHLHRDAGDVFLRGVTVCPPQRRLVLRIELRLRRPVRHDQGPL